VFRFLTEHGCPLDELDAIDPFEEADRVLRRGDGIGGGERLVGLRLVDESVVSRFESSDACPAALTPGALGVVVHHVQQAAAVDAGGESRIVC
jgi:hypothetical protein